MSEKIVIDRINKIFPSPEGELVALRDIELSVGDNEFVALVGASGCGKSTLLRIIGGLETMTSGRVLVDGESVRGPGRDRAMVFQDYSLYPWLTVLDNIRFSRSLKANSWGDSESQVANAVERSYVLLELMGLEHVRDRYPNQLSGGMRQRVAIARAIMSKPEVLLMDEPFGALDAQTREVMHDLILHLFEIEKSTIVFVTHDVEEAIYLANRVVVLAPNPGHVDSIYDVSLPPPLERHQDLKLSQAFIELKAEILHRIRETSGVQRDIEKLHRLMGIKQAETA